jgi:hypothetical protein
VPPEQTPLQSTPSLPQAPEPLLVHHKSSPSHLSIKPSRTIAGAQVPAAAAGPPPPSSPLHRSSEPRHLPSTFPRPHGSFPCNMWLSRVPVFTAVWVPAAAPPLHRRHRSPAISLADPPPLIGYGWAQSPIPVAYLPTRAPPRRWQARLCCRAQGVRSQEHLCERFKSSRVRYAKRFFSVL